MWSMEGETDKYIAGESEREGEEWREIVPIDRVMQRGERESERKVERKREKEQQIIDS